MTTQLITKQELNSLIDKRNSLNRRKELSFIYENKALSPAEYLSLKKEIEELDKKIANSKVIPQIKLNRKFTVKENGEILSMIITINDTKMTNIHSCTFNSILGKAFLDKTIGDMVEIETSDGIKKYEVISIEEN